MERDARVHVAPDVALGALEGFTVRKFRAPFPFARGHPFVTRAPALAGVLARTFRDRVSDVGLGHLSTSRERSRCERMCALTNAELGKRHRTRALGSECAAIELPRLPHLAKERGLGRIVRRERLTGAFFLRIRRPP